SSPGSARRVPASPSTELLSLKKERVMPFVFYPVYTITHRPAAGVHMVRPELVQIRHRLGEEREETARPVCNWADPAAERETAGRPGPHPRPAGPPDRWRPPPGPRHAGHREPLGGYPPVRPRWNDRQPGGRGDTGETLVSPRTHPRCGPRRTGHHHAHARVPGLPGRPPAGPYRPCGSAPRGPETAPTSGVTVHHNAAAAPHFPWPVT